MAMMVNTSVGGGKKTSNNNSSSNNKSSSNSSTGLLGKLQSGTGLINKGEGTLTGSNKSSSNSNSSSNTRSDYSSNGGTLSNSKWQRLLDKAKDPSLFDTEVPHSLLKNDDDNDGYVPRNNGGITQSVPDTSSADAYASYIAEYKAMVKDYQNQLDKLAEENYKLQVAQNEKNALDSRNQANLNSKMTDRWLNQQYGNEVSGAGITNRLRNKTALNNTIAEINNNLFNNNSSASLSRYNTISNNAKDALSRYQTIDDSYLSYLKKIV